MSSILFLHVFQQMAISLSIGAATFSLIFYYKAIRDGKIDAEEQGFLRVVYQVLRIGLGAIVISELLLLAIFTSEGLLSLILTTAFWFRWLLLLIIVGTAVSMDAGYVPSWLGPALAGASWYMYAITTTLSRTGVDAVFYLWLLFYLSLIFAFVTLLHMVEQIYVTKHRRLH